MSSRYARNIITKNILLSLFVEQFRKERKRADDIENKKNHYSSSLSLLMIGNPNWSVMISAQVVPARSNL